jgi:aconitate hydratase 2/2-methylisocitrate dehydratase
MLMQMFLRDTHDTIRPLSFLRRKKVDLGFGSCMVHKGDLKILSQMLKNIDEQYGKVEFKAPLVVAPQHNIVDELKAEGDWVLQKYSGFDDNAPKSAARIGYENILYLERQVVTYVWVTRKAEKGIQ